MSEDRTTATRGRETGQPAGEHVTIIKESSNSGLGLITLLLVIAALIAVAFVWVGNRDDSDEAITNASQAVTEASQAVGSAADEVGEAADRVADETARVADPEQ